MRNVGRPTKYKEEYNDMAYKLCLLGYTDKQLADFFQVDEATLNLWKIKHPIFYESLQKGKEIADGEVIESLYHRAKGYSHPEEKIFCNDGVITRAETTKHYAPDTGAMALWLKNRQPKLWRDKHDIEVSGDVKVQISLPEELLDDEDDE